MRLSDMLRYSLWVAVVGTAVRNRREYGVPTAWLTHLIGNSITLLLPEYVALLQRVPLTMPDALLPVLRTIDRRVRQDPRYAGYVAPLALGFITSYPEYSIYHGRWAERTIIGFGIDSVPHSTAAYALARLVSETIATLHHELPPTHALAPSAAWAVAHTDALSAAAVAIVTLVWEWSEYLAHQAEVARTGRDPREVNMQWSVSDSVTDTLSNLFGLLAALAVRRHRFDCLAHDSRASSDAPPEAGDIRPNYT